jgi:hypothetical protein
MARLVCGIRAAVDLILVDPHHAAAAGGLGVNQHPNGTPPQNDHNALIQNYTLRSEWGPDRRRSEPPSSTNSTNSINKLVHVGVGSHFDADLHSVALSALKGVGKRLSRLVDAIACVV